VGSAQIELGKLLAMAQAGRQPDSDVTVAQLLYQYVSTAGWDVSTRVTNLGLLPGSVIDRGFHLGIRPRALCGEPAA
jgi:hypothetical protein